MKQLGFIFFVLIVLSVTGCEETSDLFDEGPEDQPDFEAQGIGVNDETGLFINILTSRENGAFSGDGTIIIDGENFDIDIIDGELSTDSGEQGPIPQTDNLSPFEFLCTPRYADLTVRLSPGDFITTMRLNECEKNNSEIFDEGSFVINPCNNLEVIDFDFFNGPCLEDPEIGVEFGKDTMVIDEFGDFCGPSALPCIVPKDVLIFVPAFDAELK